MKPAKLKVFFAFFPYGGNGASASEHPNIRNWLTKTQRACDKDERIEATITKDFNDTPITMTRNDSVLEARAAGADVLVMIDSDQHPDLYLGVESQAVPFFESSFDFLYKRKMQGKPTVIGAPYCGPPPEECVYVFQWTNSQSLHPNVDHAISMYPREHGAIMAGIQECAALPTGCIMFDMDVFEVTDPRYEYKALMEKYRDVRLATALTRPWFYYEWNDIYQARKGSTEDVTATRDMLLCARAKLGHNVCFCNWDAWAGHWKPKCVGKPVLMHSDAVNQKYTEAILSGRKGGHTLMTLTNEKAPSPTMINLITPNDSIRE